MGGFDPESILCTLIPGRGGQLPNSNGNFALKGYYESWQATSMSHAVRSRQPSNRQTSSPRESSSTGATQREGGVAAETMSLIN